MRTLSAALLVSAVALAPAVASAQAPPQTYSLTLSMPMGAMTVKVARDGSKQSVEQTVPKSANGPGMHIRQIYDFAAHKVWTLNLDGGPCTVVAYTSPNVPSMFDPVSGIEEVKAGLAQAKPAALRSETVNGIATKVYELPVPEIKGKARIFLEEKYNFAVKMIMVPAQGQEQTQMEVTSLSFAKPAADLFVPPQNCQAQGGETSATGGHVEAGISATAAGQKTLGAQPPPSKGATPPAGAVEIEIPGAGVAPAHYEGPAPAVFQFEFEVHATVPVEAQWVLVSQADTAWASGKIVLKAAGTMTLRVPVKIGVANGQHWEGKGHLEIVVGGKRYSSPTVDIAADCKAK